MVFEDAASNAAVGHHDVGLFPLFVLEQIQQGSLPIDAVVTGGKAEDCFLVASTAGPEAIPHLEQFLIVIKYDTGETRPHIRIPGRPALWYYRKHRIVCVFGGLIEVPRNTIKRFDATVRSASSKHNCYIARKIHESYLIVAKDPKDLYLAAAQIQLELSQTNWFK